MTTKRASLPMYDFPEVRQATNAWWAGIARHMTEVGVETAPGQLVHDVAVRELWNDPELLLSQCCGFDLVYGYKDILTGLLTPRYAVEGCEDTCYSSWVVVHENSEFHEVASLFNSVAVINGPESHSGMNSLMTLVNPLARGRRFFRRIIVSGAHADSVLALQQRRADVAAIDCVTYAFLQRYRPESLEGLRVIGQTGLAPALPYVTRKTTDLQTLENMRSALLAAFADPELEEVRGVLMLSGAEVRSLAFYQAIRERFGFDKRLLDVVE